MELNYDDIKKKQRRSALNNGTSIRICLDKLVVTSIMYSIDLVMIIEKTNFIYICHLFVNIELKLTFYWLDHIWAVCSELFHCQFLQSNWKSGWICASWSITIISHIPFLSILTALLWYPGNIPCPLVELVSTFPIKTLLIIILLLPVCCKHLCR